MNSFQLAVAAGSIGILYVARPLLRFAVSSIFPQALPGEENTILLASTRLASAEPPTAKDLEDVVEYDYIIIGTGTAGCVLANRLTEDGKSRVLAIEAGHSDLKQLWSRMPAGFSRLFRTPADWAFTTAPQSDCSNRKLEWPRGKMIGGCSSINAMMYTRGAPDDYDEWERLGNKGWAYKHVVKYMNKAERFRQTQDYRKLSPEGLSQHGQTGPWEIGYTFQPGINKIFPDACSQIGIQKTEDINSDRGILGVAPVQAFIDSKGQRSSTAVAYLTADILKRPNLKIACGQTVTRIIFDTSGSQPRAVGVEMASSRSATVRYLAKAGREVIVASGTIGTPQLLKISGIGPAQELSQHGIPVIKDLRGVGENLMDHMSYRSVICKVEPKLSLHYLLKPLSGLSAVARWLYAGKGPMTSQGCDSVAFVRTADRSDIPQNLKGKDYTSGPTSADLEILSVAACVTEDPAIGPVAPMTHGYATYVSINLRPESRGTVKLASRDAFDVPLIDPRALSAEYDVDMLLYGVKLALKVARTDAMKKYFKGWYYDRYNPLNWDTATDEQIKDHIRKTSETLYHPMGTAKMGHGSDAVVDDHLRVHGVTGLRVVDASIFPTALACHPCAPVVMIAEKAADLVKQGRV